MGKPIVIYNLHERYSVARYWVESSKGFGFIINGSYHFAYLHTGS